LPTGGGVAGSSGLPGQYVISLCGTEPAVSEIELAMDVRPFFCPNPFYGFSHGALPIAIMGTDSFDTGNVVLSSVRLSRPDGKGGSIGSVPPLSSPWGPIGLPLDVGVPHDGDLCGCSDHHFDGIHDVLMFFRSEWINEQLDLGVFDPVRQYHPSDGTAELLPLASLMLDSYPLLRCPAELSVVLSRYWTVSSVMRRCHHV
jgi:hypothetical protein